MSDLQDKNTNAMLQKLKEVEHTMSDQAKALAAQNLALAALTLEFQQMKQQLMMLTVLGRGTGPTA